MDNEFALGFFAGQDSCRHASLTWRHNTILHVPKDKYIEL